MTGIKLLAFSVWVSTLASMGGSAWAATFTATELSYDKALLSSFNLISLGTYATSNETEGRILVGGNATVSGSTNVCFNGGCNGNTSFGASSSTTAGVVASTASNRGYGALTVFGNLTGGFSVMNGGDIDVRGNVGTGTYNLNNRGSFNLGGPSQATTVANAPTTVRTTPAYPPGVVLNAPSGFNPQTGLDIASVFPFGSSAVAGFGTPLTNLSKGIAALPGSPGVTTQTLPANQSNNAFVAAADFRIDGKQYGVVTTTLANLVGEGQNFGGVSNGSNDATFVIVTGDISNAVLATLNYTDSKVIYDFVDATSLRANGAFNATILAPLATLTQAGGVINGSVVVAGMYQSQELHQGNLFAGDLSGLVTTSGRVPEPASLSVLGAGLSAVAWGRWCRG